LVIVAICVLGTMAHAAPVTQPATQPMPRGEVVHISFTNPNPLSTAPQQHQRYGLKVDEDQHYKLADESFELYVPQRGEDSPFGAIVWISSSDRGSPPKGWTDLVEKHHLVYVGANKSGNQRPLAVRVGLALDAVQNLKSRLPIDENRVYISGISGGAKIASLMAVAYPDLFSGGFPICGVIYFRNIPVSTKPGSLWPAGYIRPSVKLFEKAQKQNRYVLITGEKDFNRDPIKDMYDKGFVKDHFAHVEYLEVPGMSHGIPETTFIEQAIDSLDKKAPSEPGR
jgi:predicted esterase